MTTFLCYVINSINRQIFPTTESTLEFPVLNDSAMRTDFHRTKLPLFAKLIRAHLRTNLRGQTRLTKLLTNRLEYLKSVPIAFNDRAPIYMDLRSEAAQVWLRDSPFKSSPQEPGEQSLMRRFVKEGDNVFDIGANLGLHTALLSRLAGASGHVYSFEPNTQLRENLNRTIAVMKNTTLFPYALSDVNEDSILFVPVAHDSMASLEDWTKGTAGEISRVPCEQRRLDDLVREGVLPLPSFVKCDVEGAELKVFRGGESALDREDAPVILFEINESAARGFKETAYAARDFLAGLRQARFQFFYVQDDGTLRRSATSGELGYWNVLAVPQFRVVRDPGLAELS